MRLACRQTPCAACWVHIRADLRQAAHEKEVFCTAVAAGEVGPLLQLPRKPRAWSMWTLGPAEETALWLAARKGDDALLRFLVDAECDVNLADPDGATPLYMAAQNGRVPVAQVLVDAQCDVNLADADDATPLFTAAQEGHAPVAQILVDGTGEVT